MHFHPFELVLRNMLRTAERAGCSLQGDHGDARHTTAAACESTTHDGERLGQTTAAIVITSPTLSTFVVFGARSVRLGAGDVIVGGDIGAGTSAPANFGRQLIVGNSVSGDPSHNLLSPSVSLAAGASVGTVQSHSVLNNGASMAGTGQYPLTAMPSPPLAMPFATSGPDVTVAQGITTTLTPGNYGTLIVDGLAYLPVGHYTFAAVEVAPLAKLYIQPLLPCAAQPCSSEVSIANSFVVGKGAQVAPYEPVGIPPFLLSLPTIPVAGSDSSNALPTATVGPLAAVEAPLSVPDRTGLDTSTSYDRSDGEMLDGAPPNDGASPSGDGADDDGGAPFCSLNAGPVSSCDAGLAAGPVQRCDVDFPLCTNAEIPSGGWGCCQLNPPGGRTNCVYAQFLPDASCQ
jgi:hypothetical protein